MADVLCLTNGLTGMLQISLAVCRRLEASGHRITYACPWDVSDRVSPYGYAYEQLPELDLDANGIPSDASGRPMPTGRAWATASRRRRAFIAGWRAGRYARLLAERRPGVVICDIELAEHAITTVDAGVPVLLLCGFPWSWRTGQGLPVDSLLTPGDPWYRRQLAWTQLYRRRASQSLRAWLRSGGTDRRSRLAAFARAAGLGRREIIRLCWMPPAGFRTLPILQATAEEFDFPGATRPGAIRIGPMVLEDRHEPAMKPADRERLDRILRTADGGDTRLVYCAMGTKDAADHALLERMIKAVSSLPETTLLVSRGGQPDAPPIPSVDGVEVFARLPQLEVLRHADLVIHHAGINTINECLQHRVPMLVYSGGRYDQNGCAARTRYHGIGVVGDPRRDTIDIISERAEQAMRDQGIASRIDAMQQSIERHRDKRVLEQAVEQALRAAEDRAPRVSRQDGGSP